MRRLAVSILFAVASVACSEDAPRMRAPPRIEAPTPNVDEPGVFLRHAGERVEVVARGLPEVHGIAFRVTWDPLALAIDAARPSDLWTERVLAVSKETSPGELAAVWTERGALPGHPAKGEIVLGSLELARTGESPARVSFIEERCKIVDAKGRRVDASFRGLTLSGP